MVNSRQVFLLLHLVLGVAFLHFAAVSVLAARLRAATAAHLRTVGLIGIASVAWAAAFVGTWLVYPGYRAKPAAGTALIYYPQAYLQAHPTLAWLQDLGMEWKEHVGWLVPVFATTAVALMVWQRHALDRDPRLRRCVHALVVIAVAASIVAAGLGALINKVAPNDFLRI
jgi:hypothetical protein